MRFGSNGSDWTYRGLLVQARKAGVAETSAVGTWPVFSSDMKNMDCPGGTRNAVTHKSNELKSYEELVWLPLGFYGDVEIW